MKNKESKIDNLNIGSFVRVRHPFAWTKCKEKGTLNEWELENENMMMGQIVGTYGPWDHMPDSTFHWSIALDAWIIGTKKGVNEMGSFSCQIQEFELRKQRVFNDVERNRSFRLASVLNDYSYIDENEIDMELVIEKIILKQKREEYMIVPLSNKPPEIKDYGDPFDGMGFA